MSRSVEFAQPRITRARMVEGCGPYFPYLLRWRQNGKRRQLTLWSLGGPWLSCEVSRALVDLDVPPHTTVYVTAK